MSKRYDATAIRAAKQSQPEWIDEDDEEAQNISDDYRDWAEQRTEREIELLRGGW